MIKNIIFDFGGVLIDWNPHYLYDEVFGSREKADWFLANICTTEWNEQHDIGKSTDEGVRELCLLHPEWKREISLYYSPEEFPKMIGGQIPQMEEYLRELKAKGFRLFGLSNWSTTFALVKDVYPVFSLMEDTVISSYVKMMKPDRRIFEYALGKFGIEASESVFVDDRQPNVDAARAAGIGGIVFTGRENLEKELNNLLHLQ